MKKENEIKGRGRKDKQEARRKEEKKKERWTAREGKGD